MGAMMYAFISYQRGWQTSLLATWFVMGLAGQLGPQVALAQGPDLQHQIRKAWQARQDRARSFRFQWTQHVRSIKGARAEISRGMGTQEVPDSQAEPVDRTFDNPSELWVDGEKVRWQHEFDLWIPERRDYAHLKELTTWNGQNSEIFTDGLPGCRLQGVIYGPQGSQAVGHQDVGPLLMALRGLTEGIRPYRLESMHVLRQGAVQGHQARLVLYERQNRQFEAQLWLDASRDYVITRFLNLGNMRQQVDVEYREDARCGWVPSRWIVTEVTSRGRITSYHESLVSAYEINGSMDQAKFDIVFPPGTRVHDAPNHHTVYIVPGSAVFGDVAWLLEHWIIIVVLAVGSIAAALFIRRRCSRQ